MASATRIAVEIVHRKPDQVVFVADPIEDVVKGVCVAGPIAELKIVVGQYRIDFLGNGLDQAPKELHGDHFARLLLLMMLDIGELAGPIDDNKQAQFVLCRPHLGNIDVKVADRGGSELQAPGRVAFGIRQTGDAVTLNTTAVKTASGVGSSPGARKGNRPEDAGNGRGMPGQSLLPR